jgi:hypothetical protein
MKQRYEKPDLPTDFKKLKKTKLFRVFSPFFGDFLCTLLTHIFFAG